MPARLVEQVIQPLWLINFWQLIEINGQRHFWCSPDGERGTFKLIQPDRGALPAVLVLPATQGGQHQSIQGIQMKRDRQRWLSKLIAMFAAGGAILSLAGAAEAQQAPQRKQVSRPAPAKAQASRRPQVQRQVVRTPQHRPQVNRTVQPKQHATKQVVKSRPVVKRPIPNQAIVKKPLQKQIVVPKQKGPLTHTPKSQATFKQPHISKLPHSRPQASNFVRLAPNATRIPTRQGLQGSIPGAGRLPLNHKPLSVVSRGPQFLHGPGRVAVPKIPPRHTFAKVPPHHFHGRFFPFVQRHWRRPFFWAFLAGVGYLTIPESYYSTFTEYCSEGDYDDAVALLAEAAIEDEDETYVVREKPATVVYKYRATSPPVVEEEKQCFLRHFVNRKWNMDFVHVSIVIDAVENDVTVPNDYYEAFIAEVAKPDYGAACRILVEAAARDTAPPADAGE